MRRANFNRSAHKCNCCMPNTLKLCEGRIRQSGGCASPLNRPATSSRLKLPTPILRTSKTLALWRQVKRLFLSEGEVATDGELQKGIAALGLIDVNDKVYFYKDGVWRPADLTPFDAVGELLNQLVPLIDSLPKIADPGKFDISIIPTCPGNRWSKLYLATTQFISRVATTRIPWMCFQPPSFRLPFDRWPEATMEAWSLSAIGVQSILADLTNQTARRSGSSKSSKEQQVQPQQQIQRTAPATATTATTAAAIAT